MILIEQMNTDKKKYTKNRINWVYDKIPGWKKMKEKRLYLCQ